MKLWNFIMGLGKNMINAFPGSSSLSWLRGTLVKIIKFLFIGGTTFIVQISSLFLFKDIIKFGNNVSVTLSYILTVSFHFLSNKFFVFRELSIDKMRIQAIKYIILAVINYGITLLVTNTLTFLSVSLYISTPVSILITVSLTFFVLNKIIFKQAENA